MKDRRTAAVRKLENLMRAGVTHFPKPKRTRPPAPVDTELGTPAEASGRSGSQRLVDSRARALSALASRVAACTRCEELARSRTQTVFGAGNPDARLVFMGEAPGYEEDQQGIPFVGRAGQLLTDIITKGMGLRREQVYILNTIKCRPPGNRTPLPHEVANCREYLEAQLAIIQPEFLCCLGAVAAQSLLGTTAPLGRLRGRFHQRGAIQVLCTYHPAYLLRYPEAKRDAWEDIQLLLKQMGLSIPGAR